MTYPPHIREKAVALRVTQRLSIDEIAERLALPKTTIYTWVRDIPLQRPRMTPAIAAMARTNREHYAALREAAYQRGAQSWPILSADPTFRDFVTLYIAEGFKRTRHRVSVGNSDPAVVAMCARWLRTLSAKRLVCAIQYHADQDLDALRAFWGGVLDVEPGVIRLQRKSNSNQLTGRTWRSQHGVLTVTVNDTYLRARMQAWMDCIRSGWL